MHSTGVEAVGYQFEGHAFAKRFKRLPWLACRYCGLILLNNSLTRWCVAKGCNYEDHPGYKQALKTEVRRNG
jgi:hypothetical protein